MGLDVRLAGGLAIEVDGSPVDLSGLGRLGQVALAYLILERRRSVTRDELADVLWEEDLPRSWETAARVVVSKARAVLVRAGVPAADAVTTRHGRYTVALGPDASVDVEVAADAAAAAVDDLQQERAAAAAAAAATAAEIAARQFLPGAAGAWVERGQAELRQLHLRALGTLAAAALAAGEGTRAVDAAEKAVALEPLHEPAWVRLMTVHDAAGSRAEALRAYERCRQVLAGELGVGPSPATGAAYEHILGTEPQPLRSGQESGAYSPEFAAQNEDLPPLPLPLTSFVGRQAEVEELARLLATSRLVTVTGPGGVGKSRLALEVARSTGDAAWVELAPLRDSRLLASAVLAALGGAEVPDQTPLATLVGILAGRRVLLVLDNCEHVLAECAALAERVLLRCPGVRVLATSRESLRLPAETSYALEPLPATGALRLLMERATAAAPHLERTPSNLEAAAQICRDLDGMPLALELAAARTRTMSLNDIAKYLDDRFGLLTRGARTAPARHRTLRAAVDWSYDTLTDAERVLFDRLSVFAGSFTIEAAEAVCGGPERPDQSGRHGPERPVQSGSGGPERPDQSGRHGPGLDVNEGLTRLVETSLVQADTRSGPTRYRLLETMRRYGRANLKSSPDATRIPARLLEWATDLVTRTEASLEGEEESASLGVVEADYDNVRAAIEWSVSPSSPPGAGLVAAAALGRFWEVRGRFDEGRLLLDAALAADDGSRPAVRARVLNWSGVLAQRQGDYEQAGRRYRESLSLMEAMDDRAGMAAALLGLGNLLALQGDGGARLFFEESLAIGRQLDDQATIAASLTNLGWLAHHRGDFAAARSLDEESLAIRRELGDAHGMAVVLGNLGFLAFQEGDYAWARPRHEESLRLREALGDRHGVAMAVLNLGHLALQEGDDERARVLFQESLAIRRELGDHHGEAGSLAALAELSRLGGDAAGAQRLLEQALEIARRLGDRYRAAALLVRLGRLAAATGDQRRAQTLLEEGLSMAGDLPPKPVIAEWLEGLAAAAAAAGHHERTARLLGAADGLRRQMGAPVAPRDAGSLQQLSTSARAAVGEPAWAAAWAAGQALTLDEAVDDGLQARP